MVEKIKIHPEDIEQITFVSWIRRTFPDVLIFHVPNGGRRSITQAMKFQKMGVVPGIPDLYIPAWQLWIEMKRTKGGSLSKDQKDIIAYLESIGDTVIVGKGWEDARKKVLHFLETSGKVDAVLTNNETELQCPNTQ